MIIKLRKLFFSSILIFLTILCKKENDIEINDKSVKSNEKLLFVWEHYRHGARDPYIKVDMKTWIDFIGVQWKSQGELNALGLRSHYLLGAATRKKYKDFLSLKYNPNELFIISTDVNRTIMSAMANLQGIFNNFSTPNLSYNQIEKSKMNIFNSTYKTRIDEKISKLENSSIQNGISIIPIHLFSKYGLQFKLNDADYCPGIQKYKDEAKNQEQVRKILNDFYKYTNDTYGEAIFKFMNISWEKNPNYIFEDSNLYYICDAYIADYFAGRDMPHIIMSGLKMKEFYYHALNHSVIDTYYVNYGLPPTNASYITVSPMFRTIFNYMDRRIYINEHSELNDLNTSSPKYVIYSGHDSTVGAVDVFMNAEYKIPYENPEYTTSLFFELWEIDNKYYIKYLVNLKEKAFYEYDYFKQNTMDRLFEQNEVEEICLGERNDKTIKKETIFKTIFFVVISIAIVCFLLLLVLLILYKKKRVI